MTDKTIKEDIERLEEILDGISDKVPQYRQALEMIKDMQFTVHDLKAELERINLLKS